MADVVGGSIVWNLDIDAKKFDSGLSDAKNKVEDSASSIEKNVKSLSGSIVKSMHDAEQASKNVATAIAAAGTAVAGFIGYGVKMAGDLETSRQGFVTLLKSTEKADEAIAMIKKDAAATPFEIQGLINANQLLTSITKDSGRSEKLLLNVGKALAAMGKGQPELDRLIVNLQQIGAVGKASMLDIKQFAFAGIPIFDMLKKEIEQTKKVIVNNNKAIGKGNEELKDLQSKLAIATQRQSEFNDKTKQSTKMSNAAQIEKYKNQIAALSGKLGGLTAQNGKAANSSMKLEKAIEDGLITFDLLENMFNKAGGAGGEFEKAFENQAGTFNQLMSNFKENLAILSSTVVTKSGLFDIFKNALTRINEELAKFDATKIQQGIQFLVDWAPVLTGVIGGALAPAITALAISFGTMALSIAPFIIAGAAIGWIVQQLVQHFGGWDVVMQNLKIAWQAFSDYFTVTIFPMFQNLWTILTTQILPVLYEFYAVIASGIKPQLMELWSVVQENLIPAFQGWWNMIAKNVLPKLQELWDLIAPLLIPAFENLSESAGINAVNGLKDFLNVVIAVINFVSKAIAKVTEWVDLLMSIPGKIDGAMSAANEKLQGLNPFHRNSPSLVDNVQNGVAEIQNQYSMLNSLSIPSVASPQFAAMNVGGGFDSGSSTTNTSQSINIEIGQVNDKADVEMISREIAFRTGVMPA